MQRKGGCNERACRLCLRVCGPVTACEGAGPGVIISMAMAMAANMVKKYELFSVYITRTKEPTAELRTPAQQRTTKRMAMTQSQGR